MPPAVTLNGSPAEVDRFHVDVVDYRAEALGLGAHVGHQRRAVDTLGEAGEVLDLAGDHQLAAGHEAGDDERLEVGASGVDGRGQAGRPAADDEHACVRTAAALHRGRGRVSRLLHGDRGDRA